MVKNLFVNNSSNIKIDKLLVHKTVHQLKNYFELKINSLTINFVSTEQIEEINIEYLNHHYSTDIITFNYEGKKNLIDGEIFISSKDAEANSKKYNVSFNEEIIRLVIHGILHLLGYDDKTQPQKIIMKKYENKLLKNYKFLLLSSENN